MAAALEWRSVVWGADENELVEAPHPFMSRLRTVVASAPGDEPTHAVADKHQSGQRHRPALHKGFERFGECAAVDGDMDAAVVVQINGRVPEVTRQGGAVIVPLASPLQ